MVLPALDHAPLPTQTEPSIRWGGLRGAAAGLAAATAARRWQRCALLLAPDAEAMRQLEAEYHFFAGVPAQCLPWRETLPYEALPVAESLRAQRMDTLCQLPRLSGGAIITTVAEAMHRLPPRAWLEAQTVELDIGDNYSLKQATATLSAGGYRRVDMVCEVGEFAVRGALLDLYPASSKHPLRIELCDEQIDSLRYFDPDSQRTVSRAEGVRLAPVREYRMDEAGIEHFLDSWHQHFDLPPQASPLYRDLAAGRDAIGAEYYAPLFFPHTDTLFDYLPTGSLLIACGDIAEAATAFERTAHRRHRDCIEDSARPPLNPSILFLDATELKRRSKGMPQLQLSQETDNAKFDCAAQLPAIPPGDTSARLRALGAGSAHRDGHRLLLTATSQGRREILREQLQNAGMAAQPIDSWPEFLRSEAPCQLAVAPLERSFELSEPAISLLSESALHPAETLRRRAQTSRGGLALGLAVRDLSELKVGDLVVHEDHGLGRYLGLETMCIDDIDNDFLMLEYAGSARLYVPVGDLSLVRGHITAADATVEPELHRLGGRRWQRAVRRAARRAGDVAAALLAMQARRQQLHREPRLVPAQDYQHFAAGFPFMETADQTAAIAAVLEDMSRNRPMDRLICGDVGLGKTEVALRAAFITVYSGAQVALLTPTTILAEQHAATVRERFADWPVRVGVLSRLNTASETGQLLDELGTGQLDIVIGTHRLLQQDVRFHQLGLVIIDEEQRFGLRHKERFKELRAAVDVLSLTATPIPRTLHVALSGLRDLSVIATAPEGRLPVRTLVTPWDHGTIRDALQRELQRGGQVYYVQNKISRLNRSARELGKIHDEATIRIVHGGMGSAELRSVMDAFYQCRCNVLVCTTIIESGLDVPNANTIIIERADQFGLAQLHQLRGRVGRAQRQAHAYFLIPSDPDLMRPTALLRMAAVRDTRAFGAGFVLARRDLELRGGGELLGLRQSGEEDVISPGLYTDLLERAVRELRGEPPPPPPVTVSLGVPALLPASYVGDVNQRLVLYRRIDAAEDEATLQTLEAELFDRFGALPQAAHQLLRQAVLAQRARRLSLCRLEAHERGAALYCRAKTAADSAPALPPPPAWHWDGDALRYAGSLATESERHALLEQVTAALERAVTPS